jgi:hypothetical protein
MLKALDTIGFVLAATMILGPMAMSPSNNDPQSQATSTDALAPEARTNGRPAPSTAITPNPPVDMSNTSSPAGALMPNPNDRSTSPEQSGARDPGPVDQ